MKLLLRWVFNAMILLLLSRIFTSLEISGFYIALVSVLILGLINAIIRPFLLILTLPINILTLGLFTFVINGLLFWFASSFIDGFRVSGFWMAIFLACIYSLFSMLFNSLLKNE